MIIPSDIEQKLLELENEIDAAHADLLDAEEAYGDAKANYEIGMAKARLELAKGVKTTAQEREDAALAENSAAYWQLLAADAVVKGSRANVNRLRTKVDIVRSLGANTRVAMEM